MAAENGKRSVPDLDIVARGVRNIHSGKSTLASVSVLLKPLTKSELEVVALMTRKSVSQLETLREIGEKQMELLR